MGLMPSDGNERVQTPFAKSVAFEITQTFGSFYVAKLSAQTLLDVCFVEELQATTEAPNLFDYGLKGTQRQRRKPRISDIARFLKTSEAAFPNTIILAANYQTDGTLLEVADPEQEIDPLRWRIDTRDDGCLELIIPTSTRLANVIDGQHRLLAFEDETVTTENREMELLCAIYLDLPSAYQGYLFATINFNQKPVDKSLAYQLYGLTGDEKVDANPDVWSPDRTAVALSKRLNLDPTSPFYRRIKVAAQNERLLFAGGVPNADWRVSTATVVDGILRLFSKHPKIDRHTMFDLEFEVPSRSLLIDDGTPLRSWYLKANDKALYEVLFNYFASAESVFWNNAPANSYIKKTVGIQALFEVLHHILAKYREIHVAKVDVATFTQILTPAKNLDFSDAQASNIGKVYIREQILTAIAQPLSEVIETIKKAEKSD